MRSLPPICMRDAITFVALPAVACLICLQSSMWPSPFLLPCSWNIFRVELEPCTKFVADYTTYLSLMLLFTARMVYLVHEELKKLRGTNPLTIKQRLVSAYMTAVFSVKLMWPALIQAMYFTSSFYYPWAVATAVAVFSLIQPNYKYMSSLFSGLSRLARDHLVDTSDQSDAGEKPSTSPTSHDNASNKSKEKSNDIDGSSGRSGAFSLRESVSHEGASTSVKSATPDTNKTTRSPKSTSQNAIPQRSSATVGTPIPGVQRSHELKSRKSKSRAKKNSYFKMTRSGKKYT